MPARSLKYEFHVTNLKQFSSYLTVNIHRTFYTGQPDNAVNVSCGITGSTLVHCGAGHVARMVEERGVYRVLVGKPEGKRPLGRPRRRWVDNIRMDKSNETPT